MSRPATFTALLLLTAACASATAPKRHAVSPGTVTALPSLPGTLTPGPVAIGFKSWLLRAQASEFQHGAQHLVQINVWYPATPHSGSAMTFRDYALLKTTENTYDEPSDAARQAAIDEVTNALTASGVSPPAASRFMNAAVAARMDAMTPIKIVRAPIVFIAPGRGQSAADQAIFAEFIASHGFVVVTIPSVTRLTGPLASDADIGLRAEEQADDIDRAASAIGDWPIAVNIPVSVIGTDLGADATLLYAMHQPVNALVILSPLAATSIEAVPMFDRTRKLPSILTTSDLGFLHAPSVQGLSAPNSSALAATTLDFLDRIWDPIRPR